MNRQIQALLAFVALVVATSVLLSARVALQVGYTDALRDQRELRAESELLRNRLAVLDRGAKAFLSRDIAILENLFLDEVEPGDYFLAAQPVKMCGIEAAPARAVLITDLIFSSA